MKAILYLKLQYKLLLGTSIALLAPSIINHNYLTTPIPNFHLILLIVLMVLKLIVFKESSQHKKAIKTAKAQLIKELHSPPSKKQLQQRIQDLTNSRDSILLFIGVMIITIEIFN